MQRERLHRLALERMHQLAETYAGRGEVEQALYYAWRQLELDPWLEEAHVQVMRCLALAGRRSEALAQYNTCCRLLALELGVEPAAATTRLYEQIRDGGSDGISRMRRGSGDSDPRILLICGYRRSAMQRIDVPIGSEAPRISRASTRPTPSSTVFIGPGVGSIST